ncbi:MAG: DUF4139 domain-containing protein [Chloroflexi bacterium]|nr:DUF4139 domain-containing protein [Chloroflexota bacterium]
MINAKRVLVIGVVLAALIGGAAWASREVVGASPPRGGEIFYESYPDEVALYLSDIAFVRDTVVLPAEQDIRIVLPPGTYPNTLVLYENGERVHNYRIAGRQADEVFISNTYYAGSGGTAYIVTWEPGDTTETPTREITLEYLLPGASWQPSYDMLIQDEETVALAFFAEIANAALVLEDTTVYLVAGRVDLAGQVDQVSQVTMNQYVVGYEDTVALPALGVGTVDLQHIYPLGAVTAEPGDTVYVNLADAELGARRLHVWNAAISEETDVIYKVTNRTDVPLAEGIVRTYQDNLFIGSDFIETTPIGSEGSVTVGSLPDVRVRRSDSKVYQSNDNYLNTVELEISNFGENGLDLMVLDFWQDRAWDYVFPDDYIPEQRVGNILEWEVTVPAGESLIIRYEFRTRS